MVLRCKVQKRISSRVILGSMFTCNTICICILLPKSFMCLLQQEIRSVNDALVYLKSRSEKLFPLTRRCFQLLLIVRPITRYTSQSSSSSMTDCISSLCKEALFLPYSDVRNGRLYGCTSTPITKMRATAQILQQLSTNTFLLCT